MSEKLTDKEKKKEYNRRYLEKNKEKEHERKKKWKEENKEKMKLIQKNYREKNREKEIERLKKYRNDNLEKERERKNLYERLNREKTYNRIKKRRETDPLYKLSSNIRSSISYYITSKGYQKESRTHEILGCSFEQLKHHLENQFIDWMNWDNYGNPVDGLIEPNKSWDIDHIIPLSSATNEQELLELCKYTNLQPLCSYHNRFIKRDN